MLIIHDPAIPFLGYIFYSSDFQSMALGPASLPAPENLLEMQMLKSHPDLLNQWCPAICDFKTPPADTDTC